MDNQRILLWAALGFLLLQVWTSWQLDYGPRPAPVADNPVAVTGGSDTTASINQEGSAVGREDLPTPVVGARNRTAETSNLPSQSDQIEQKGQTITVTTDTLRVEIGSVGGDINSASLLLYPTSLQTPDDPFVLLSNREDQYFVAQSGLQSVNADAPSHHAEFSIEKTEYFLADGQDEIRVPLTWTSESGLTVTKTFIFQRDRYLIDLEYDIKNTTGASVNLNQYRQLRRKPVTDDETQSFIYTFIGGVVSTAEDAYTKIDFDDFSDITNTRQTPGGWAAIIEHYFASAWIPHQDETSTIYTKALSSPQRYIIGLQSEAIEVADGASALISTSLFVGPKIQERMREIAPHLDLTVDYGFLSVIAKPIFWLLGKIHSIVGNWGWAIVGVTMCIKLLFYKLSEASYRSMARMRKLQPQLASLKERYGDDRAKMGQATMDLYKKEKVNPLGGCLPIMVQIPVFISLYWVLLESVELRQAPWILWIEDLSLMDKYYVLPVIMGITMFIQQKLNPAPVDPIQAKVFMFMPLIFTIFFAFFPAGLVLYWVVNNTLSIAQQYYITRHVLAEK
ncbi:membrane protein insertase YidC [Chromatiales bacterium (ex Bugula neritina AB1)]|nr:membrane protein insertase YidC [Chromatiales bacterium (ex Bugula neritina AB1)]